MHDLTLVLRWRPWCVVLVLIVSLAEPARAAPSGVRLLTPPDGRKNVVREPVFRWEPTGTSGTGWSYELLMGRHPSSLKAVAIPGPAVSWGCDRTLSATTTYFWKVRAIDGATGKAAVESAVFQFTTESSKELEWVFAKPQGMSLSAGHRMVISAPTPFRVHLAELATTPEWCRLEILDDREAPAYEISGEVSDVTLPHRASRQILRFRRGALEAADLTGTAAVDRLSYLADRAWAQKNVSVRLEQDSEPAFRLQGTALREPWKAMKEERVFLSHPGEGIEYVHGQQVPVQWSLREDGLPTYRAAAKVYWGRSRQTMYPSAPIQQGTAHHIAPSLLTPLYEGTGVQEFCWFVGVEWTSDDVVRGRVVCRSPLRTFRVRLPPCPTVTIDRPADRSRDVSLKPTLHWSAVPSERQFHRFRVLLGRSPQSLRTASSLVAATSSPVAESLEPSTLYHWHVEAHDPRLSGRIAVSRSCTFHTASTNRIARGSGYDDAIPLPTNVTVSSYIRQGAFSFFTFMLASGQTATLTLEPLESNQDLVAESPTKRELGSSANTARDRDMIVLRAGTTGAHYARVVGTQSGKFNIRLTVQGPSVTAGSTGGRRGQESAPTTATAEGGATPSAGSPPPSGKLQREWVVYYGSSGNDIVEGATVDAQGSLYLAGHVDRHPVPPDETFRDLPRVTGPPAPRAAGFYGYVAKLDADGSVAWSSYLTAEGQSWVGDVAADPRGNLYVVGCSQTGIGMPGMREARGGVYVARLNAADGRVTWAVPLGIVEWPAGVDAGICVDSRGDVYVAHHTDLQWGGQLVGAPRDGKNPGGDAFVTKLTPAGTVLWSRYIGGEANDAAHAIAADAQGNVYVAGGTWWFGAPPARGAPYRMAGRNVPWRGGRSDGFLASLDASGTVRWVTGVGGAGDDVCRRVLVAGVDLIVGGGNGSADLNEPLRGPHPQGGPFLAGSTTGGRVLWTSHCEFHDRAGLGGLAISSDGRRAFATSVNVHGLGISQARTDTGDPLPGMGYADVLRYAQIGARHIAAVGTAKGYYMVDSTDLRDLPDSRTEHAGRLDVFVAKLRE